MEPDSEISKPNNLPYNYRTQRNIRNDTKGTGKNDDSSNGL